MRALLPLLPLLIGAVPPATGSLIAPATIDDTLDITGEALAARRLKARLSVPVHVNGQGPFRFVVDSGADRSVVSAALATRLALPADVTVMLHGIAGSAPVQTVFVEKLAVGTSEIEGVLAPALPEAHLGADGLLGIDALADQRLMLDFQRREIVVQDSRTPVRTLPGEIVVTARRRHGQLIITQAYVGEQRIAALIDTGSEITMANGKLRRLLRRRSDAEPIELISVTGQKVLVESARLPEVRLGKLTLRDVAVGFGDIPPFALFGLADQPALLLGNDVLEQFRRVSLDFGRRTVRFQLKR